MHLASTYTYIYILLHADPEEPIRIIYIQQSACITYMISYIYKRQLTIYIQDILLIKDYH